MKFHKRHLLQDLLSLCSGEAMSKIAGFIAFAYLARNLGPDAYGLVELAVALSVFFMLFIDFGYGPIGAREISKDPLLAKQFTARIVSARLLIAIVTIPIMGIVGYLLAKTPMTSTLIWLYAIALFAIPWDHSWLLQGLEHMSAVATGRAIRMVVFAVGVMILVHSAHDYWIVGLVELVAAFCMASYYLIKQYRLIGHVGFDFSFKPLFDLSKQSAFIGLSNAVWASGLYAPTLFVASLTSTGQLAWFSAAHRIAMSLIAFSLIYHFNLFPSVSKRLSKSSAEFNSFINSSIKVSAWFGIGIALIVTLISRPLCTIVFGSEFSQTAGVLNILVWALPITLLSGHARWSLIAGGFQRYVFYAQVSGLIITIVACWLLVPTYQAKGGAFAMVASTVGVWAVAHMNARRYVGHLQFIEAIFRPLLMVLFAKFIYSQINNPWLAFASALLVYISGAIIIDWKLLGIIRKLFHTKDGSQQKTEVKSKDMNFRIILLFISILFLYTILKIPHFSIAQWLNPLATDTRLNSIATGARILKYLLVTDVIIFLLLLWQVLNKANYSLSNYQPLWVSRPLKDKNSISEKYYYPILFGLLILALVLRSISLGSDLWIDEVISLVKYIRLDYGALISSFDDDNQHMLFSLLSRISIGVFGENEASIRMPVMLFGVASIWATSHLVRYVFSAREALLVATILVISYHHIWFSQNARGYAILLFGTVLATELLLHGLETGKWKYWIGYAFTIAATTWVHLTAVFIALAHGLVCIVIVLRANNFNHAYWRPFLALIFSAWITIHLYALVLPQLVEFFTQPGPEVSTINVHWKTPWWLISEASHQMGIDETLGYVGILAVVLIGGWGLFYCLKRNAIFTWLTLLPAILLGLTLLTLGRNLWPRMFYAEFSLFVTIAVVGAIGIGQLLNRILKQTNRIILLTPVTLLIIAFVISTPKVYEHPKQDFKRARDFVKQQLIAGDAVVGIHMAGRVYNLLYAPEWAEVNNISELKKLSAKNGRTWVLYTLPGYIKTAKPTLESMLQTEFEFIKEFPGTLGDGEIIVLRSKTKSIGESGL